MYAECDGGVRVTDITRPYETINFCYRVALVEKFAHLRLYDKWEIDLHNHYNGLPPSEVHFQHNIYVLYYKWSSDM